MCSGNDLLAHTDQVQVLCSVLQCVVVCCSLLQCVAVRLLACSVNDRQAHADLKCMCFAVYCSVLQCVAVCCSVLQCVALCCSVLQAHAEQVQVLCSV